MSKMEELEHLVGRNKSARDRWAGVGVVAQARENADTESEAKVKWSRIYKLFEASGETEQDEVFAAVNYYFLVNGCSPNGKYSKPVRTASGKACSSGDVVKVTGRLPGEIRQFLRGRLYDSYTFLKNNQAIHDDEELGQTAENAGVSRSSCWMLADWLGRDCKYFVGEESTVYNALRTSKIAAAHEKAVTALPEADLVREKAPEAKIPQRAAVYNDNHSLF